MTERVLTAEEGEWMLDLDTGKTHGPVVIGGDSPELAETDLSIPYSRTLGVGSLRPTLITLINNLQAIPVENSDWGLAAEQIPDSLFHSSRVDVIVGKTGRPSLLVRPKDSMPRSFVFHTDAGNRGLLQIVEFTEEPAGVKLRYKMVKRSPESSDESPDIVTR